MKRSIIFFVLFLFNIVFSQNMYPNEKSIIAIKTDALPEIDGNVVNDPIWKKIIPTN